MPYNLRTAQSSLPCLLRLVRVYSALLWTKGYTAANFTVFTVINGDTFDTRYLLCLDYLGAMAKIFSPFSPLASGAKGLSLHWQPIADTY